MVSVQDEHMRSVAVMSDFEDEVRGSAYFHLTFLHNNYHVFLDVFFVMVDSYRMLAINSRFLNLQQVNIAQFHPYPGHGIVYGTKRGKIRSFSKA